MDVIYLLIQCIENSLIRANTLGTKDCLAEKGFQIGRFCVFSKQDLETHPYSLELEGFRLYRGFSMTLYGHLCMQHSLVS